MSKLKRCVMPKCRTLTLNASRRCDACEKILNGDDGDDDTPPLPPTPESIMLGAALAAEALARDNRRTLANMRRRLEQLKGDAP